MRKLRFLIGISGIIGFSIIFYLLIAGKISGFDDSVRFFFYGLRGEALTPLVKALTYLGNWQSIATICVVLLVIRPTRINYGLPVSVGAVFVSLLNKAIKIIVARPRPDDIIHLVEEGGFSFASGHSITSVFFYGALIYLMRKNIKNKTTVNILTIVLIIPMAGIGLSRIYLGVHYPSDVLAGWCLGIACLAALAEAYNRTERLRG